MISVGFKLVSKNVRVGFAVNLPSVAIRETNVLPSACESVPELAGYPQTVEISYRRETLRSSEIMMTMNS